ncbi:RHS repeat-associated core domain-containing protein [Pseudomonas sp. RIT-PI-q]|uniref:RHS repeat-associated core domain-containing protein n=1 Tax=Pseudomonas sp. RIT-PI-q TaxID=1690247 RepID=UPI0009EC9C80|nr:RHS repeat-associated core domain-containing protein [Pseudomonas sp. RIT-PI-q]
MSSTQPSLRCRYRYDPLDRLISHTRPDTPTHQRFYCKSRLATEIQGAVQYSIIQHGDLLLAQQQRDGDETSANLLATDLQRSVLHTLEKNHQRQSIAYSPYGHRPAENGLTSLLGFNGERVDSVTGHYLLGNGYRAFNTTLMRFNSPDSWSPFGKGGLNGHAYCLGELINKRDPNGHSPFAYIRALNNAKSLLSDNGSFQIKKSASSKQILEAAKHFTKANQLPNSIESDRISTFLHDYEHRNSPNLQNTAIKTISKNNLSLENLPPTMRSAVTLPARPYNSSDLLETIAIKNERGQVSNYDHEMLKQMSSREIFKYDSNGKKIKPGIAQKYLARLEHIRKEDSRFYDDYIKNLSDNIYE